nr:PREDICTED: uncharacterized protein LOC105671885 [Linepithema humile]
MSTSLNIANKKHVWEYYVKLSDFEAQCKFCENRHIYLKDGDLKTHMANHHIKIWKYEEEKTIIKGPWMSFKYLRKSYSQCIICNAHVLSTFEYVKNHLSSHSEKQRENHTFRSWPWKYSTKKDDFVVECNICNKNVFVQVHNYLDVHIKVKHWDKLKNTQETHDTVGSSECVSSLQTNTTSKSLTIVTKKHLWKYFVKLPDFKAQCMFCENIYYYINNGNFYNHMENYHDKFLKYEQERKLIKLPWMYFKYLNKSHSQCIICDANVLSTSESVENHLGSHSEKQRKNHIFCSLLWKYSTKRDDFVVECNICNKNVSLHVPANLDVHIKGKHWDKLKNTQKTHDTVGSSECVSSLQTVTTSKSLTIVTKKNVWKYCVKLPNFKAQCIFCEKKYYYITVDSFRIHIARHHRKIWKYEEEKKRIKLPWMYFKYSNKLYSQCIICNANVRSTSESTENHLSSHSEKQRKNHILRSWPYKYMTRRDDFVVECNICYKNFALGIYQGLIFHIKMTHSDKLKNTN